MSGLFDDLQPDLFADLPVQPRNVRAEQRARGWTFAPSRLLGQIGAGAVTALPDATVGLYGLVTGNETAQNIAEGINEGTNQFFGVQDPNWRDNTPEFIARNLGGAVVGVPARALRFAGEAAPAAARFFTTTRTGRALEALTPVTLPLNPGRVAANTAGASVIGIGAQELMDDAARADAAQAPPAQGNLFDDLPTERTVSQIVRDNLGPIVLGAIGTGAGLAMLRSQRLNAQVAQARNEATVTTQPTAPGETPQPLAGGGIVSPEAAFNRTRDAQGNLIDAVRRETTAERFTREVLDDTATAQARLREAARDGLLSPQQVDEINAGFATSTQQAVLQDRTNARMRDGEFEGIRFTPSHEYEVRRVALAREDARAFALYNEARAAMNELDDRKFYAAQGMPNARRQLSDKSTAELELIAQTAQRDPRLAALIAEDQKDNRLRLQVAVRAGLISPTEAGKLAGLRPGYLHTLTKDNTPLTRRNMQTDQAPNQVADPILSRQDAWMDVISRAIENRQRQQVYAAVSQINQQIGDAPSRYGFGITGPIDQVRKNVQEGMEVVPVRFHGETFGIEVAPEIAQGMRTFARATMPVLSATAQLQRNATTGPLAALLGYVQAPISAAYGAGAVMFNRPRGMSAGYIDRATGGKLPIIDPTFIAAQGIAVAQDIVAETARAAASQVMRSIYSKGTISRMIAATGNDPRVIQQKLQGVYEESRLAEMRRLGSTGTGITYDPAAAETMRLRDLALTPEYARMQGIDPRQTGPAAIAEYAAHFGGQVTPATAQRAWRLFTSYLNIISDSPVSAFVMLNRDAVSPTTLHGTARRLQGDPAARGGSRAVQAATSVMNYSNITMQATRQFARAFQEQPGRMLTNIMFVSGIGAAITVYSAMQADEEEGGNRHMQALMNADSRRLNGGAYISLAGVDPINAIRLPMEPIIAAPAAYATVLLSNAVARADGSVMPGMGAELGAFLSGRTAPVITEGLSRAINPLNAPPGVTSLVQLAGGPDITNFFNIVNPRIGAAPRDVGAPGYADTRLERDPISRPVDLLLGDVFSIAGEQAMLFMRQMGYGVPMMEALSQTAMAGIARNPGVPALMSYTRAEPQRGMIGDQLMMRETAAGRLAQGFNESVLRPDVVGSGASMRASPNPAGADRVDPSVLPLLLEVRAIYNAPHVRRLREERNTAQEEIIALRSTGRDPELVNEQVNGVVRRIQNYNATMLREYLRLERAWQQRTGRDVRIDQLNPLRPLDQFPMRGE